MADRIAELRHEMQGEIPDGTTWEGTEQAEELAELLALTTYRYVLCWNGGQASYDTLGETFADAGDRVKRGESVHIYPILNGGA